MKKIFIFCFFPVVANVVFSILWEVLGAFGKCLSDNVGCLSFCFFASVVYCKNLHAVLFIYLVTLLQLVVSNFHSHSYNLGVKPWGEDSEFSQVKNMQA